MTLFAIPYIMNVFRKIKRKLFIVVVIIIMYENMYKQYYVYLYEILKQQGKVIKFIIIATCVVFCTDVDDMSLCASFDTI